MGFLGPPGAKHLDVARSVHSSAWTHHSSLSAAALLQQAEQLGQREQQVLLRNFNARVHGVDAVAQEHNLVRGWLCLAIRWQPVPNDTIRDSQNMSCLSSACSQVPIRAREKKLIYQTVAENTHAINEILALCRCA